MGEELDQQRVCVGGVVTGVRRVITKSRATMGVATLEDLQGTMEVIVFPKVFEQTEATWAEDAILLVAGRVDHKGDETVLLAEAVWTWEEASAMGAPEFARRVGALERGRRGGSRGSSDRWAGNGNGNGHGNGRGDTRVAAVPVAVGPGAESVVSADPRVVRTVPLVSPLRGGTVTGTIDVAFAGAARGRPLGATSDVAVADDEPPLPDEVVAELIAAEQEPTLAVQAAPGQVLHVNFEPGAQEAIVAAMRELREIVRARPGETPLVLHIPAGGGRVQRMELRSGVAYDAELVATINRRLGARTVRLNLV
jgi:hypothetical protein